MTKKILLVEDDPFLSEIYVTKFEEVGYEVEIADNGLEGLDKIKSFKPDIVLLDIILPKMNGLEVLKNMRKEDSAEKDTLVIILSNLGAEQDVENAMELGADSYLIKSQYTPSEVVSKIEEELTKK